MGLRKLRFCVCCNIGMHGHCSVEKCWCEQDRCVQSRKKKPLCKGLSF